MELKLAGYVPPSSEYLDDMEHMRMLLSGLCHTIGMTIINGPTVTSFKEWSGDSEAGLSGFCIIAESHVCFHAWPEVDYIYVEIDSCKSFDTKKAENFIKQFLGLKEVQRIRIDEESWAPPELEAVQST